MANVSANTKPLSVQVFWKDNYLQSINENLHFWSQTITSTATLDIRSKGCILDGHLNSNRRCCWLSRNDRSSPNSTWLVTSRHDFSLCQNAWAIGNVSCRNATWRAKWNLGSTRPPRTEALTWAGPMLSTVLTVSPPRKHYGAQTHQTREKFDWPRCRRTLSTVLGTWRTSCRCS